MVTLLSPIHYPSGEIQSVNEVCRLPLFYPERHYPINVSPLIKFILYSYYFSETKLISDPFHYLLLLL